MGVTRGAAIFDNNKPDGGAIDMNQALHILTSKQIDDYNKNGYLVLRGVLTRRRRR